MEKRDESTSSTETSEIPKSTSDNPVDPDSTEEPKGNAPQSSDTLCPDDVLCDSCIESPTKALKSCLTCLVSYCEDHLKPHLENSKFQNHRLVEPLHDIECRSCEAHPFPLDRFCVTDGCCVCRECEGQGHQGHTTASVVEARKQIQTELLKKQGEIVTTVSAAEKAINKLQSNNASVEKSVAGVRAVIDQQFGILQAAMEEARRGAVEVLEGEQRRALRQAEGIQAHLEQRQAELKKTLVQIDKLSRNKADVDFLQAYCEWKIGLVDVSLTGVCIGPMDHLASFSLVLTECTQDLGDQILTMYREKLQQIFRHGGSNSLNS
ncbi:tripartite motif-containing protein 16-like [Aplochiton taeniatus]